MAKTAKKSNYSEENIKSLDWKQHIRLRPGMYIGKTGDGAAHDDGIYILIKEIIDNSIDEFVMGNGNEIHINISEREITVRDFGRGIPLGKVFDCVAKPNTGAKYDSEAFKKSVGLNGIGTKAVNALSMEFKVQSIREGKTKIIEFSAGELVKDHKLKESKEKNGTIVTFIPDDDIFHNFHYRNNYIEKMLWNYAYLNTGLTLVFNGTRIWSENGLLDLLNNNIGGAETFYPIIHLKGEDIEVAMTHGNSYGEEYYSFVNGQYTPQGGSHQQAFREAIVKTIKDFYKKDFDPADIRSAIIAAVSVKIMEPVFESQTKTRLGSTHMSPDGLTIRQFMNDFIGRELDNFLHKHPDTAEQLKVRIMASERERKDLAGIKKLARERAKKAAVHNKKLRDCRLHLTDKNPDKINTTLFITEGDSASGSITKARDVNTQAVFSLKGKPLNTYGLTKKIVYENEEFNLLQHALDIEDGIESLRYNNIVIATDADVDGMHIRLLMITFFLQFFPDVVKGGHLYILQTPLFRVRNKKETIYCYDETERQKAMFKLGKSSEITRFKGLGEISPDEFRQFINKDIRLEQVEISKDGVIKQLLEFYMGKNTPERQEFIIKNLKIEVDLVEEEEEAV